MFNQKRNPKQKEINSTGEIPKANVEKLHSTNAVGISTVRSAK